MRKDSIGSGIFSKRSMMKKLWKKLNKWALKVSLKERMKWTQLRDPRRGSKGYYLLCIRVSHLHFISSFLFSLFRSHRVWNTIIWEEMWCLIWVLVLWRLTLVAANWLARMHLSASLPIAIVLMLKRRCLFADVGNRCLRGRRANEVSLCWCDCPEQNMFFWSCPEKDERRIKQITF